MTMPSMIMLQSKTRSPTITQPHLKLSGRFSKSIRPFSVQTKLRISQIEITATAILKIRVPLILNRFFFLGMSDKTIYS